jgi:hypothetical protein
MSLQVSIASPKYFFISDQQLSCFSPTPVAYLPDRKKKKLTDDNDKLTIDVAQEMTAEEGVRK